MSIRIRLPRAWVVAACALCGCDRGTPASAPAPAAAPTAAATPDPTPPGPFRFTDIAAGAGVDFVHCSGTTPEKYFPTANGSGVAIFDHDGDGRMDVYFATARPLKGGPDRGPNRLYRNLGGGRFADATQTSGLGFRGVCHGIVVGDIDNDGDPDVFLANYGPNALFENVGGGAFRDISASAGVARAGAWSSGGAFLDYDDDGDLDLYVANYGAWDPARDDKYCGDRDRKIRRYCSPKELRTIPHFLYRNDGGGRFTEVAKAAGVGRDDGHGFAAVAADLDGDGKVDLYVTNDQDPNFLYLNNGDGTFRDASLDSGAGLNADGKTSAGMGVDAEDVDGDGRPELFATNFADEYNTLYRNLGGGNFLDCTAAFGLAADSIPFIGWGCALADLDNDGWPDAFVADARIDDNAGPDGAVTGYDEPPLLHRNLGGRRFRRAGGAGPYFAAGHAGHGVAVGDLDDDGDLDLVVNHKDAPPAVLRNDTPAVGSWVRLRLVGRRSNRDGVGARVEVSAGGRTIVRGRKGGASLMSSHDPRMLVGLGGAARVDRLKVTWPSGRESTRGGLEVGRDYEIIEPE